MVALQFQDLSWKTMVVLVLVVLILKENISFTKLWPQVVFMVEELVNSVLPFWKAQAGINPTTPLLNLSSSDKVKVATSSINNAVTANPSLKNSVLEAPEVVLLKEDLVVDANLTPRPTAADTLTLKLITIVKILMLLIMLDSLTWKPMEDLPIASASKVT